MQRNKIIFYKTLLTNVNIDILYKDETFWLSQKQLAELFATGVPAINKHIKNILEEEELTEATISKMEIVRQEGSRTVKRNIDYYNLDMVIAVGYRVNSKEATQFRIWATNTLKEFIIKGFVLDDDRLKNGQYFGEDYFKELLERIRSIRSSERRIYQQITDIFAECSIDYDKNSLLAQNFYAHVQNKFHYAITGNTAAEIVHKKADSSKLNMGLKTWKKSPEGKILKLDVSVAKNYLDEKELKGLERIVSAYFDYIEGLIERRTTLTMNELQNSINKFLDFNEYKILDNFGTISHEEAKQKAYLEYDKFKVIQDKNYISDFDKVVRQIEKKKS
jgi:hypothetical protein